MREVRAKKCHNSTKFILLATATFNYKNLYFFREVLYLADFRRKFIKDLYLPKNQKKEKTNDHLNSPEI